MSRGFRVEHHPETANPITHPYGVFRKGPIIWFRERKYAELACDALNNGASVDEAASVVANMKEI